MTRDRMRPPELISHYELQAAIGRGGMGVVYRARDVRLDRIVAVKLLEGGTAAALLLKEAQSAARLNHPNVCVIYEVGDPTDGAKQGYIAMEYIDGVLLTSLVAHGPLSLANTVAYGVQIASALDHAHVRGIVHGDLKPSNVMVVDGTRVKLLDFGLAKEMPRDPADAAESSTVTRSVQIAGTVPYMAPELLRGQRSNAATDVWSLGVVLYEMAAGCPPFQGATAWAIASNILEQPVPAVPGDVPTSLRAIISRCLDKDPHGRPKTAAEVASALAPVAAPPASGKTTIRASRPHHRPLRFGIHSIAVLPMDNLSGNPEQEHVAEGITDALIATLSRIERLRVVSRTSVMKYKRTRKSLPQIAEALGVDAIVEGSVIREGGRVRVSARLIEARDDAQLWSETYDRHLHDMLSLQSELARAIVDGIRLKLSKKDNARLSAVRSVETAAYDAYLRGRYHWNRRTGEDLRKALAAFREAIAKDPTYAPAYVGIADCHLTAVSYGTVAPMQAMPEMKSMVLKALALESDLPEAHLASAMVNSYYDWDWVAAERAFQRTLDLAPRSATANVWYGLFLASRGRPQESMQRIEAARALDPLSPAIGALSAWALHFNRRHDEALTLCAEMLELEPNFFMALMFRGLALEAQGKYDDAVAAVTAALKASGDDRIGRTVLARVRARAGDTQTARSMLAELTTAASSRYLSAYHVASIHVALAEADLAFEALERAYRERALHMTMLGVDPAFDDLRGDPRFAVLQERLGWQQR